ncbi:TPA: hypothetical protein KRH43_000278 [Clostridioides difficile]|nr:hypothetical protein [Clostridioides difficile]
MAINVLHQKNIFTRLQKKQNFDLRLFVTCGVYQQISVEESAQKNRENKK